MNKLFRQILKSCKIEYLILDQHLKIVEVSPNLPRFALDVTQLQPGKHIQHSFPELASVQDRLNLILQSQETHIKIPLISRQISSQNLINFAISISNFTLDKTQAPQLLVICQEITGQSEMTNESVPLIETSVPLQFRFHQFLSDILANLNHILITLTDLGLIQGVNPTFQKVFGYQEVEVINQKISDIIPEFNLNLWSSNNSCFKTDSSCQKLLGYRKTGEEIMTVFSCTHIPPLSDLFGEQETDENTYCVCIGREVSTEEIVATKLSTPVATLTQRLEERNAELRQLVQQLETEILNRQQREKIQSTQFAVTYILSKAEPLEAVIPQFLQAIGEGLDLKFCEFWWVETETETLKWHQSWSVSDVSVPRDFSQSDGKFPGTETPGYLPVPLHPRFPQSSLFLTPLTSPTLSVHPTTVIREAVGLVGKVWATGTYLWCSPIQASDHGLQPDLVATWGIQTGFAVPIRVRNQVIGVIACFSDRRQEQNSHILRMMSALGSQIGQYVDRHQAEAALRESEEKYRSLYAAMSEGATLHELIYDSTGQPIDYRIIDVNPAYERIVGLRRSQVIGRLASEVYGEESPYLEIFADVTQTGQPVCFETWFEPLKKAFQISVCSPAPGKFATVFADITERQRTQAALRESESRLSGLMDSLQDVVWSMSASTFEILYLNPAAETVYGRPVRDFYQDHSLWSEAIYPEDRDHISSFLSIILGSGNSEIECRIIRPDGTIRWINNRGWMIEDENGIGIRIDGLITDITERKEAEVLLHQYQNKLEAIVIERTGELHQINQQLVAEIQERQRTETALRIAQERLQYLLASSPAIIYSRQTTDHYQITFMSENIRSILGYAPEAFTADPLFWEHHLHPDDALRCMAQLATQINQDHQVYEYRFQHQDGSYRWMRDELKLVRDQQGQCLELVGYWIDITTSKQAEAALIESENKYRSVVNSVKEVIFQRDHRGYLTFLNPAWTEITGFTVEESLGKHFLEFVHPEERSQCLQNFQTLIAARVTYNRYEVRYLTKTGGCRWMETQQQLTLTPDGKIINVSGTLNDITDRKEAEAALERERQQLRQIITHAPVAMAMLDRKLCYLAYSNQWLTDYHLQGQNLINQCHFDIFPNLSPERQATYQRVLAGEVLSKPEDVLTLSDQTQIYFRWAMQPWFTPNNEIGGIVIVTQVINELVEARETALEAARAKSQFLANMSHEIRTPMNGVIGMTDLLLRTPLTSQQQDFVQTLRVSGQNLLLLINDILDFSKLEAGEMRLDPHEFDLNICLEEVVDLLGPQAQSKGLELLILVEAEVPTGLKGDASRLRQVLMNLVGNGIKFTEKGEIVIHVASLSHTDFAHPDAEVKLRFEVRDTGIGISVENQKKLFQSFSQVDSSTTRKYGGTGLGLAICKQLVILMGGEIGIESTLGSGSTFWFTGTFGISDQNCSPLNLASTISGKRLLVVDSNVSSCQMVCAHALTWGLESHGVYHAQDAMVALRTAFYENQPYHLVLIDLQNSETNGEMLGQFIRFDPLLVETRWIVMVSIHQHQQVKRLLQQGASGYLLKPIKASRLLEMLLNSLAGKALLPSTVEDKTAVAKPARPLGISLSHLRILVVEDTPINQKVLLNQLQTLGVKLSKCVSNGSEALKELEQECYDIVLMDCLMPILDGYKTTQAIRLREGERQHTIIIAMTANALKGDREKCLEAGMDDYISKPVDLEQLSAMLQKWSVSGMQLGEGEKTRFLESEGVPAPGETSLIEQMDERLAKPEQLSPEQLSADLIDRERLQQITGGDLSFELELLQTFLEDATIYLEEIKRGLQSRNLPAVARRAHQLKGGAATIALRHLPDLAKQLERYAQENRVSEAMQLVEVLEMMLQQVARLTKNPD